MGHETNNTVSIHIYPYPVREKWKTNYILPFFLKMVKTNNEISWYPFHSWFGSTLHRCTSLTFQCSIIIFFLSEWIKINEVVQQLPDAVSKIFSSFSFRWASAPQNNTNVKWIWLMLFWMMLAMASWVVRQGNCISHNSRIRREHCNWI